MILIVVVGRAVGRRRTALGWLTTARPGGENPGRRRPYDLTDSSGRPAGSRARRDRVSELIVIGFDNPVNGKSSL